MNILLQAGQRHSDGFHLLAINLVAEVDSRQPEAGLSQGILQDSCDGRDPRREISQVNRIADAQIFAHLMTIILKIGGVLPAKLRKFPLYVFFRETKLAGKSASYSTDEEWDALAHRHMNSQGMRRFYKAR